MKKLPKFYFQFVDIKEFISFWSDFYSYSMEGLYTDRLRKEQLSTSDITKLFEWKNGSRLSGKKEEALKPIIGKLDIINRLKKDFVLDIFLEEFKFIKGKIWKIYLLHILSSGQYPIFDQHAYRAFCFISKNQRAEIPSSGKEEVYFDEYVPFFSGLVKQGIPKRKLDKALWAFGKFLKSSYGSKI